MSIHFQHHTRPQGNSDASFPSGRGEPPRPAGFIKLMSERDSRSGGRPADEPPAISQADGSA